MTSDVIFHEDRLWSILNRAWRPLSREEFEYMSYEDINLAITAAELSQHDINRIWEKKYKAFEVY